MTEVNDVCAALWPWFSVKIIEIDVIMDKNDCKPKKVKDIQEEQQSYTSQKHYLKGEQTQNLCALHIYSIGLPTVSGWTFWECPHWHTGCHAHTQMLISQWCSGIRLWADAITANQSCTNLYLSIRSWVTAGPWGREWESDKHMDMSDAPTSIGESWHTLLNRTAWYNAVLLDARAVSW